MSVLSFERVKYADTFIPESMVFQNGSADIICPIIFAIYLIRTESAVVLFDAGCNTMPDFDIQNFIPPTKAIECFGVSADDVTDIIISHAHHDHIEAVNDFKNARIHIQRDEYKSGKSYINDEKELNIFDDETVIDNSVKVIKIGGHSKGSCIALFDFDGKKYVICGDECYSRDNLKLKLPTGSSFCLQKSQDFIDEYSSDRYTALLMHQI